MSVPFSEPENPGFIDSYMDSFAGRGRMTAADFDAINAMLYERFRTPEPTAGPSTNTKPMPKAVKVMICKHLCDFCRDESVGVLELIEDDPGRKALLGVSQLDKEWREVARPHFFHEVRQRPDYNELLVEVFEARPDLATSITRLAISEAPPPPYAREPVSWNDDPPPGPERDYNVYDYERIVRADGVEDIGDSLMCVKAPTSFLNGGLSGYFGPQDKVSNPSRQGEFRIRLRQECIVPVDCVALESILKATPNLVELAIQAPMGPEITFEVAWFMGNRDSGIQNKVKRLILEDSKLKDRDVGFIHTLIRRNTTLETFLYHADLEAAWGEEHFLCAPEIVHALRRCRQTLKKIEINLINCTTHIFGGEICHPHLVPAASLNEFPLLEELGLDEGSYCRRQHHTNDFGFENPPPRNCLVNVVPQTVRKLVLYVAAGVGLRADISGLLRRKEQGFYPRLTMVTVVVRDHVLSQEVSSAVPLRRGTAQAAANEEAEDDEETDDSDDEPAPQADEGAPLNQEFQFQHHQCRERGLDRDGYMPQGGWVEEREWLKQALEHMGVLCNYHLVYQFSQ